MAIPTITDFRNSIDGRVRPNRFSILGDMGKHGSLTVDDSVLVKSTFFPDFTVGTITIPFKGWKIKHPGDRSFSDWSFNIYMNDPKKARDFYTSFMNWQSDLSGITDVYSTANESPSNTWIVSLRNVEDDIIKNAKLWDCYPISISDISLSNDLADTITSFSVTIAYNWIEFI